jgi:signal transduction histidine kinase
MALRSQQRYDRDEYMRYYGIMVDRNRGDSFTYAYRYFNDLLARDLGDKDTLAAFRELRLLSYGLERYGLMRESEIYTVRALRLLDHIPPDSLAPDVRLRLTSRLAEIHRKLGQPDMALRLYDLSLAIDLRDSINILNDQALVFEDLEQYPKALTNYRRILELLPPDSLRSVYAKTFVNMGTVQSKMGQAGEGLANLQKAYRIWNSMDDHRNYYAAYHLLAEHFMRYGQRDSARHYARMAYRHARSLNIPSYLEDAMGRLIRLQGDTLATTYLAIRDSLEAARAKSSQDYAGMQYDFAKAEARAELSEQQRQSERKLRLFSQLIGGLLVVIAALLTFLLRARYRREQIKQVYETETRISKRVHDEVANDLYRVMSKIQQREPEGDFLLDQLEEVYNRTRDIARELADIDVKAFDLTLADLLHSYRSQEVRVITRDLSKVDWEPYSDLQKKTLYRVLQELLTNMKKHSGATLVAISFMQQKSNLQVQYADNGKGAQLKKGNGLRNTENRMETIKGAISFESKPGSGCKATITF